jgi:hypothetical protein
VCPDDARRLVPRYFDRKVSYSQLGPGAVGQT